MLELDKVYCSTQTYRVEHSWIDFTPVILSRKLSGILDEKAAKKRKVFNQFDIAEIVHSILESEFSKVNEQKIIKKIVDAQFEQYSRKYFVRQFWFFLIFNVMPFTAQIFVGDKNWVIGLNCVFLASQILLLLQQVIFMVARSRS